MAKGWGNRIVSDVVDDFQAEKISFKRSIFVFLIDLRVSLWRRACLNA